MFTRKGLWTAALTLASALLVTAAQADLPKPAKEAKEAIKEAKKDLKEAKKDAKEAKGDDKKDAKKDAKEALKDLREARQKLRDTRKERREEMLKSAKDKWGDLVKKPKVREELKVHARRMARLNHMEALAKENNKTEALERIQKLRDKENARHEKRMEALKAKGGDE